MRREDASRLRQVTSGQEFRQARFGQSGHHSVDPGLSCVRREQSYGRSGLCAAGDRRVRRAGLDPAWIGAVVSGTGVVANVIGGVLALGLIVYLFIALIKPEKF